MELHAHLVHVLRGESCRDVGHSDRARRETRTCFTKSVEAAMLHIDGDVSSWQAGPRGHRGHRWPKRSAHGRVWPAIRISDGNVNEAMVLYAYARQHLRVLEESATEYLSSE